MSIFPQPWTGPRVSKPGRSGRAEVVEVSTASVVELLAPSPAELDELVVVPSESADSDEPGCTVVIPVVVEVPAAGSPHVVAERAIARSARGTVVTVASYQRPPPVPRAWASKGQEAPPPDLPRSGLPDGNVGAPTFTTFKDPVAVASTVTPNFVQQIGIASRTQLCILLGGQLHISRIGLDEGKIQASDDSLNLLQAFPRPFAVNDGRQPMAAHGP